MKEAAENLRVIICDDERPAREFLATILRTFSDCRNRACSGDVPAFQGSLQRRKAGIPIDELVRDDLTWRSQLSHSE
jgi:hypothetical protein